MSLLEITNKDFELLEFYRQNPTIALEDLLNVELVAPQRIIFKAMWENNFSIVTASRGTGKTYLMAAFACLRALLYPGTRVGLLAPSFRQSKLSFEEVRKIWFAAPILREATSGKPTFQSDRCVLNFRTSGTIPPSLIEADPLGTGEKIRGLRMHVLLIDEFAQLPPVVFDAVIKPMAATSSSPVERVKEVARRKRLVESGVADGDMPTIQALNKIIMLSSAFYKFNHMYKRIENYEKLIAEGKSGYATKTMNYLDMPDGFMNEEVIQEARETMPSSLFRMEYLSVWESDSEGLFKASLLESCKLSVGDSVKLKGTPGKQYVISCDPARSNDYFSTVVIELGEKNKVVAAYQFQEMKFPKMADFLVELCNAYGDVVRLLIDSQGGGQAIKDIISDDPKYGASRLIDIDDEEYIGVEGRRILQMIRPSPTYNAEANFAALNLLESGKLGFAGFPTSEIEEDEVVYLTIQELIMQLQTIVVTQTKSGTVHFDVPTGGGHKAQKKDLYSAFIYGAHKIHELSRQRDNSSGNIIWTTGCIIPRGTGMSDHARSKLITNSAVLSRVP